MKKQDKAAAQPNEAEEAALERAWDALETGDPQAALEFAASIAADRKSVV